VGATPPCVDPVASSRVLALPALRRCASSLGRKDTACGRVLYRAGTGRRARGTPRRRARLPDRARGLGDQTAAALKVHVDGAARHNEQLARRVAHSEQRRVRRQRHLPACRFREQRHIRQQRHLRGVADSGCSAGSGGSAACAPPRRAPASMRRACVGASVPCRPQYWPVAASIAALLLTMGWCRVYARTHRRRTGALGMGSSCVNDGLSATQRRRTPARAATGLAPSAPRGGQGRARASCSSTDSESRKGEEQPAKMGTSASSPRLMCLATSTWPRRAPCLRGTQGHMHRLQSRAATPTWTRLAPGLQWSAGAHAPVMRLAASTRSALGVPMWCNARRILVHA